MKNSFYRPAISNETFGANLESLLVEQSNKIQAVLFSWFPGQSWVRVFYKSSDSFGKKVEYYVPGELMTPDAVASYLQLQNVIQ